MDDPKTRNDLGGRVYSEDMQHFIYLLTIRLKERDSKHKTERGLLPSQYMKFYVKAAGIIVEAAINLTAFSPGGSKMKNFLSWINTLTGFNIIPSTPLDESIFSIEGRTEFSETKTLERGVSHEQ